MALRPTRAFASFGRCLPSIGAPKIVVGIRFVVVHTKCGVQHHQVLINRSQTESIQEANSFHLRARDCVEVPWQWTCGLLIQELRCFIEKSEKDCNTIHVGDRSVVFVCHNAFDAAEVERLGIASAEAKLILGLPHASSPRGQTRRSNASSMLLRLPSHRYALPLSWLSRQKPAGMPLRAKIRNAAFATTSQNVHL